MTNKKVLANKHKAPLPSEEDAGLIKMCVLLTLVLDVLERDIRIMNISPLKMPDLYIRSLTGVQQRVTVQLADTKARMKRQGVKIYSEIRNHEGVEVLYVCRGYQRRFFMLSSFARSEVRRKLGYYLGIDLTQDYDPL
ncbi:hypothetical protein ACT3XG_15300 [Paenibacillus polymyxa]|jgi:hypothetical protein|uniref:hypothetical protein n=1 Tax=Paenibacillus TaxID=44249 RepID=UPI00042F59D3|nr:MULTISPECIES: hypothetical protein [Paenibacillus]MDP9674743.1 hypothetical protein [Paenibacillus jamilae]AHM66695.1 hypothetical protein PPSQR21_030530 [Paenibacillus polymyxa SQR-21]AIY07606.1 hypothetical protein LK13_02970 [Paenibacillus polymyxa]AUS27365.1 hypothetical protein C1A50_3198 [Paenibacillus polymyxa]KAE8559139.1 hypothetical protein BJH92_15925 [Paenibacillus polymyxa]